MNSRFILEIIIALYSDTSVYSTCDEMRGGEKHLLGLRIIKLENENIHYTYTYTYTYT